LTLIWWKARILAPVVCAASFSVATRSALGSFPSGCFLLPLTTRKSRYQGTVAVTSSGVENFTDFLPSELNEIEKLIEEEGVVQERPPASLKP
jgi:hypothetical protein